MLLLWHYLIYVGYLDSMIARPASECKLSSTLHEKQQNNLIKSINTTQPPVFHSRKIGSDLTNITASMIKLFTINILFKFVSTQS